MKNVMEHNWLKYLSDKRVKMFRTKVAEKNETLILCSVQVFLKFSVPEVYMQFLSCIFRGQQWFSEHMRRL
jgi:hypothetical protein